MMRLLSGLICLMIILAGTVQAETLEEFLAGKVINDYQLDPELVQISLIRSALKHDDLEQPCQGRR